MEALVQKRNEILKELWSTEQKIGKAIETSSLYTSLMDHCIKSKKYPDKDSQNYCKKQVMIKFLELLEVV
jgi:hypothetical protein